MPAIYVPLPYGNGEQRRNALPVVKAGGGLIVDDGDLTPDWIEENVIPLARDRARLAEMSAARGRATAGATATRLCGIVYGGIDRRRLEQVERGIGRL